ncbi:MAG: hypothetical protein LC796_00970 [Acidobacteria bacterium]|nr:hypothetical protein [Acidobacteriota bacterium]
MAGQYQGIEALFNRTAQNARDRSPDPERHLLFLTDQWTVAYGFTALQEVYRLPPLAEVKVESGRLSAQGLARASAREALVVIRPELASEIGARLEAALRSAGKTPCTAGNLKGTARMVLWQSPELPRFCE